jgi:uncharacterized protein (DUF2141 family)
MNSYRLLGCALGLGLLSLPAAAGELRVSVEGLRSAAGTILIGLYDSARSFDRAIELSDKEGFLNDPDRVAGVALRANPALEGGVVFTNVTPGRYAIILFHDEDGNGRLDKNFWGVPTEPYGFSNDAQGFLGPPDYKDAAMELEGGNRSVEIALVYHAAGVASLPSPYEDVAPAPAKAAPAAKAAASAPLAAPAKVSPVSAAPR